MSRRPITETTHLFGRDGQLCGVVTRPGEVLGVPVVILGAGIIHKVGPSRASVFLSRTLAGNGHPVLRFDLSGIGDSERAPEAELSAAVIADIDDAITFLLGQVDWDGGVCLVGFCSGADNGFFVARDDARVEALAQFDPTVHRTRGFVRRRLVSKLTAGRTWKNLLTGRTLLARLLARHNDGTQRPPGYYGLLTLSAEEADAGSARLRERGVRQLYVLSGGIHDQCNAPQQIRESLPNGFDEAMTTVAWCPDLDHILSEKSQQESLAALICSWLRKAAPSAPLQVEAG